VFVPVKTMPGWLQSFARVNPVTNTAEGVRALCQGGPTATHVLHALAWVVAILLVFVPLSVRRYRRV